MYRIDARLPSAAWMGNGGGTMIPETYIDGIGWIGLSGGMIRIDFVTFAPAGEGDNRQPTPEIRHRLIMTPAIFLRNLSAQQGLVAKLQEAGLGKRLPERNPAEPSPKNGAAADAIPRPPQSPNFRGD